MCMYERISFQFKNIPRKGRNKFSLLSLYFLLDSRRARFEFDAICFKTTTKLDLPPSSRLSNFLSLTFRFPSVIYDFHCSTFLRSVASVATIKVKLEQRGKEESVAHPLRWRFRVKYRFSFIGCEIFQSMMLWFLTPRIDSPRLQLRLSRSAMG